MQKQFHKSVKDHSISVADTLWSVHIKCDFHQKKTRLKAATEVIERQHKSCEQPKPEKRDKQTTMLSQCCQTTQKL